MWCVFFPLPNVPFDFTFHFHLSMPHLRFESHLGSEMSSPDTLPETLSSMPLWDEPKDLDQLTSTYVVENKYAGRTPGTTLYLVQAKARNGELREVADDKQEYKLFLADALL